MITHSLTAKIMLSAVYLPPNPFIYFQLTTLEDDFIYAAEFGDIPTVQRILEENPHFNVDFSDILGRTPLRLAVGNEHLEVNI